MNGKDDPPWVLDEVAEVAVVELVCSDEDVTSVDCELELAVADAGNSTTLFWPLSETHTFPEESIATPPETSRLEELAVWLIGPVLTKSGKPKTMLAF